MVTPDKSSPGKETKSLQSPQEANPTDPFSRLLKSVSPTVRGIPADVPAKESPEKTADELDRVQELEERVKAYQ